MNGHDACIKYQTDLPISSLALIGGEFECIQTVPFLFNEHLLFVKTKSITTLQGHHILK